MLNKIDFFGSLIASILSIGLFIKYGYSHERLLILIAFVYININSWKALGGDSE